MKGIKLLTAIGLFIIVLFSFLVLKDSNSRDRKISDMTSDEIFYLFLDNGFKMPGEVLESYGEKSRVFFDGFFNKCTHCIETGSFKSREAYISDKKANEALTREILRVYKLIDKKYK